MRNPSLRQIKVVNPKDLQKLDSDGEEWETDDDDDAEVVVGEGKEKRNRRGETKRKTSGKIKGEEIQSIGWLVA